MRRDRHLFIIFAGFYLWKKTWPEEKETVTQKKIYKETFGD